MTLAVVLSFVVLLLLCTLALVWSRWPAWLKGLLVVGVSVFYFYADDAVFAELDACTPGRAPRIVFSGLDASVAGEVEGAFAAAGLGAVA